MGHFAAKRSKTKLKFSLKLLNLVLFHFWWISPIASLSFSENLASTVRTWPSHSFFMDIISNATNSTYADLKRNSIKTFPETSNTSPYEFIVDGVPSAIPSALVLPEADLTSNADIDDDNSWNRTATQRQFAQTASSALKFDVSAGPIAQHNGNPSAMEDSEGSTFQRMYNTGSGYSSEIMAPIPKEKADTVLQLLDRQKYLRDSNGEGLVGIPWINDSVLVRRVKNIHSVSPSFLKVYALNSFRISSSGGATAPSVPLYTTAAAAPVAETTIESPLSASTPQPPRISNRHIVNIPAVSWGIAPVRFEKLTTTPTRLTSRVSFQDERLSLPGYQFTRPISTRRPSSFVTLPPVAEPFIDASTTPAVSGVLLKMWEYSNENLHLQRIKDLSPGILGVQNFSDGQILNWEEIPLQIKQAVASAFNLSNSITKRHSGPGGFDAFHWQQLPSILPPSTPPPSYRPKALNYIVWPTTTMPPSPPSTPSSQFLADEITKLLFNSATNSKPVQNQQYSQSGTKVKEADILTNVASMALIMSKINKELGQLETRRPVAVQSSTTNQQQGIPPEFWATLLPLYMNYLKHGQDAAIKKSGVSSPSHRDSDQTVFSSGSTDFNFYPSPVPAASPAHKVPPRDYDDYKTSFVVKKVRKKFKKKYKKNKSSKNTFFLDPGKFDFNYEFGIDLLQALQKGFYTLLALKAAPLIILTLLTVIPLTIVLISKLLKGAKLADIIWSLVTGVVKHFHKHPKIHHHYYPAVYKHHSWSWKPYHGGWSPPTRGWTYGGWSTPSYNSWTTPSYSGWSTPYNTGWSPPTYGWSSRNHRRIEDGNFDQNLVPNLGSMGQETYSDATEGYVTTATMTVDVNDLDTVHNQKVMDILLNARNITLQKLLESWELDFPSPNATLAELSGHTIGAAEYKRRRRNVSGTRHKVKCRTAK